MPDLSDLISRVEKASGPDRELDAEVMFDLYASPVGAHKEDGAPIGYLWPDDDPSWSFGIRFPGKDREWFKATCKRIDGETLLIERDGALVLMNRLRIPPLTASLDAVLTLLPKGMEFELTNLYGVAAVGMGLNTGSPCYARREDGNITLALLSAILRARQAMQVEASS